MSDKAVVLLSGGIDSSTTLAIAKAEGYELYALSFDYGQRHSLELEATRKVAAHVGVEKHLVVKADMGVIGGSALTADMEIPKGSQTPFTAETKPESEIPITYVPARNTIFLSYALGWAEVLLAPNIFIGANVMDYSGYPDCRPEFLKAFEETANLATKASVEGKLRFHIKAPLLDMTKGDIIRKGLDLGLDYSLTWSCYDPTSEGIPCGACDSCLIRAKGFTEAGAKDPLIG
jgi:7-cyano-7-deazaguanine synthase